ncbi:MFS transporter [Pelagicoccus sp. NFK12]|uniref:MFS transporter n=1 Tax=Pelagicoccus enzymogenes TaxID=2773457 RepID=A0A927F736_9BACT|nr:MFS transporter [Pelagicoccus enzymogenes]MBD5779185.1 MFS transporter [Pelagicoccus enzymogenes]MDQ8198463.1 MFS transporter [Pelagicoccus enzymogenes]
MSTNASTKLSFREKAGYSLGDASANFIFQMFIVFPTAFYVDVMGISAAAMGTMLLLVRFSDAITDPIMGYIADRTNTRWGKFRPWLLWSAIPFALLFWVAFTVPEGMSDSGRLWYAAITYTVLMMAYTMNNVPYSALNGVMTSDGIERTSVSSYRFFAAMVAAFFVQGFTLPLVDKLGDGDDAKGWSLTIGIMAVTSIIFFVISFFSVKERVQPPKNQKPDLTQDFRDILKNRPWLAMFGMTLFVFITLALRGNAGYVHAKYYLDPDALRAFIDSLGLVATPEALQNQGIGFWILDLFGLIITPEASPTSVGFSLFNMIGSLVSIIGVLAAKPLARLFGKKAVFTVGLALAAMFQSLYFFIGPEDISMILLLTLLTSMSYGPTIPLLWAMIADTADYGEWKHGRRSTGFVFAGMVFALKAGLGIGGALAGWLLAMYGYTPETASQPEVQLGIRKLLGFYSGGFFGVGVLFMLFYPITKKVAHTMEEELKLRHSTQDA